MWHAPLAWLSAIEPSSSAAVGLITAVASAAHAYAPQPAAAARSRSMCSHAAAARPREPCAAATRVAQPWVSLRRGERPSRAFGPQTWQGRCPPAELVGPTASV